MIDVGCPQCGVVYHTLEANVGKRILCTKCGYVITIALAVTHPSHSAPEVNLRAKPSVAKGRGIYNFAIVGAVAVALIVLLVLRHPDAANRATKTNTDNAEKWKVVGEESPPVPNPPKNESTQPADPRPTEYNSLPTGTRIEEDNGTGGHGKLTVENGTTEDAVVRVSDATTDQTVRWFFVKAHNSAHLSRIPQGSYRLTYTTGLNWVESDDGFSWQPTYNEFERTLEYAEQRDSEGVRYHTISVSLNSVLFGNVRTRTITREEFLKGHRHVALEQPN
jgi:hypothetical protein